MYKKYKQKCLEIISDEGLLSFFKRVLKFIASKTIDIRKLIIFELDLQSPVKKTYMQKDLFFKVATKRDIDSMNIEDYGDTERGRQYSKERQTKGDKCILAIKKGKIIGYVWIMKNHMELSSSNYISILSERVYLYKNFVLKEHRGKRVLNAIDYYLINVLRKEGKKYIVTTIDKGNKPAIKARDRIGFKRIGKIIQFRFFGLKYDYISKKDLTYLQYIVNYTIESIKTLEKFMTLKNDWNRLFNLKEGCPIFFSFEVFKIYYQTILDYYDDVKIEILVVRNENQKVVAILPFTVETKEYLPFIRIKELSIKDSYLLRFYIFLVDSYEKPQLIFQIVVKYLKKKRKSWDIIKFYEIQEDEKLYEDFTSIFFQHYLIQEEKVQTLVVDCDREFKDFTKNDMNGKDRREMRRKIRRLNEKGEVKFIEMKEKKNVEVGITNFYDIEDKNWKGRERTSLKQSYYGEFFKKLAFHLVEDKKLRLYFLQLNDEYIAGIFAIIDQEICYLIKIGYNEDFYRYSPSNILFYLLFKSSFSKNEIKKIDFYGEYYGYQKIFGEHTRTKYSLTICNDKFFSTMYFLLLVTLKKLSNQYPTNLLYSKIKDNDVVISLINKIYR